ncbi:3-methyladenine DNA glycosylase [Rhodococcus sp. 06-235-1A]|uniref:3-methyladenine DNA glycosylase n=1 Tax=Rhodococcus sp. 06-235-1A TaxID=2022508 RepID=UPI000B9C39D5|nr:3-methyladenine DNA glycosylase [Rhodococcus sp. 06-235-1A]OZD10323.1 3-methyladenine DNA glycosylase [Rhodococcus sp. 06-235-1A]
MSGPASLTEAEWTTRQASHVARVGNLVGDYLTDRGHGIVHPVLDFLFTYYSHRPGQLRRWNPGHGIVLTGDRARDYAEFASYEQVETGDGPGFRVRSDLVERRRSSIEFTLGLLTATAERAPLLGCFGLHEWAMVYRGGISAQRHEHVPLRLGRDGTDAVVDSMTLRCTHYDAFRFFTPDAAPRNTLTLSPQSRLGTEQPGCIHASMDLYKWCYKLGPLIDSEFLTDCFELALHARTIDMRASPYDLSDYDLEPIRIETAAGRAEYVRAQGELSDEAAPLRSALIARCQNLLIGGEFGVGPTAE